MVSSRRQCPIALGGLADREHLGVGARVLEELALVVAGADELAVRAENHGADGDVVVRQGLLGLREREPHPAVLIWTQS